MDHLTRIGRAIDFIEDHLADDLPIERIARQAYFSMWHFQRVFGVIVGMGVKEYVRKRRLAQAMTELTTTRRRIIDIALYFRFESQEAFTRAFKANFGRTPGDCRKRGAGSSRVCYRPKITMAYLNHLHGSMRMQPKFIEWPEKKIVGLGTKFISALSPDKDNMKKIPKLWDQFIQQTDKIKNRVGHASFGLVEMLPKAEEKSHRDELFYIACAEVADLNSVPAGMIHRVMPKGKYAVFTHKGMLNTLEHTMNFIYGSWLPKAKIELRDAPHVELYDERFIPDSDKSEFDIMLPVK